MGKVVIAAAGTSGHIRPAWVLGHDAVKLGFEVLWIGSERDVWRHNESWDRIDLNMSGVRGSFSSWFKLPFVLLSAVRNVMSFFNKHRPDLVILMGGYVTLPVALVAKIFGVKYIVFEQNTVMCLSNRIVLPWAFKAFSGLPLVKVDARVRWIGNPLPRDWCCSEVSPVMLPFRLLIMGGSQGARTFNTMLPALMKEFADVVDIVHIAGDKHYDQVKSSYQSLGMNVVVYGYKEDLYQNFLWADLVITRSGAMSISECLALALPSVMVPFPHATDDHQLHNARWIESINAGVCIKEDKDFIVNMRSALIRMLQTAVLESMRKRLIDSYVPFNSDEFWK